MTVSRTNLSDIPMDRSDNGIRPRESDGVEPAWDDRSAPGDEPPSDVTAEPPRGTTGRPLGAYGWVALLIAASGVVNVLSATKDIAQAGGWALTTPVLFEVTSALVWIAFFPIIRYGIAQLFRNRNRLAAFAIALATALLYALLHQVALVFVRKLVFGTVGKAYAFHWATDFPYELRKDVVSALMIGAVFWLIERRASASAGSSGGGLAAKPVETVAGSLKPGLWLRDGATSFHVDPRDIIAVTSAGNYVEFNLRSGRRLVRGTLAAEETRLKPFGLVRVHRTRLANLNHVVAAELKPAGDFLLRMDNGETIAGSRRYRSAAMSIRQTAQGDRPRPPSEPMRPA